MVAEQQLPEQEVRTYRPKYSGAWWLRRTRTFAYMAREFTAVPIALWWFWFLIEVARVKSGPHGYSPHMSTGFVVFSCVCLLFALFHAYTFLSLAGFILRIPIGLKTVPARVIATLAFGAFFVASAIIAALLVFFGR